MAHAREKLATLLPLLVVGACVATTAEVSRAADATVYRSGDFDRANVEMTACPGQVLPKRYPKMSYFIGTAPGEISVAGSMRAGVVIWVMTAKSTGPKSSHVELRNKGAKPEEIEEVWHLIEWCAKR